MSAVDVHIGLRQQLSFDMDSALDHNKRVVSSHTNRKHDIAGPVRKMLIAEFGGQAKLTM